MFLYFALLDETWSWIHPQQMHTASTDFYKDTVAQCIFYVLSEQNCGKPHMKVIHHIKDIKRWKIYQWELSHNFIIITSRICQTGLEVSEDWLAHTISAALLRKIGQMHILILSTLLLLFLLCSWVKCEVQRYTKMKLKKKRNCFSKHLGIWPGLFGDVNCESCWQA